MANAIKCLSAFIQTFCMIGVLPASASVMSLRWMDDFDRAIWPDLVTGNWNACLRRLPRDTCNVGLRLRVRFAGLAGFTSSTLSSVTTSVDVSRRCRSGSNG
jgi:hypothetical protein